MLRLSIIVPAFNEEKTILEILKKVNSVEISGVEKEIIVIDDCSSDNTLKLLESNPSLYNKLVKLEFNSGKGAAVKKGLKEASGEYILFQDADLEYDPHDYPKLLEPVLRFNADLVIGSRLVASQLTRVYYFWHKLGNKFITLLFNILNNTTFTDIYSCYLLFKRNRVNPDKLSKTGWEQQAEILSQIISKSDIFYEVPVNYYGRTYEEGKKIRARHAFAVILTIVSKRLLR